MVGLLAPCPPWVPRAGHLFHSALLPRRPGAQFLFSECKSEWMMHEHMQRALGSHQLPMAASPKVPLGSRKTPGPGLLSPVCSRPVPHSQEGLRTLCMPGQSQVETCLGADVRAWPSLNFTKRQICLLKPPSPRAGLWNRIDLGRTPGSCLTVGSYLTLRWPRSAKGGNAGLL